jgi:hypothetical protein
MASKSPRGEGKGEGLFSEAKRVLQSSMNYLDRLSEESHRIPSTPVSARTPSTSAVVRTPVSARTSSAVVRSTDRASDEFR